METEELRSKLLEEISKLPEEQSAGLKERIEGMSADELHEFVKQSSSEGCFFCQIAAGKIETIKVYQSANILAILDINPANPGHMLVIPKQHYQFITQMPAELINELFSFVKYLSPILLQVVKAQGIDVYIAQGISQKVPHLAINILPRFKDDKLNFEWKRRKVSKSDLETIAAAIRAEAKSGLQEEQKKPAKKKGAKAEKESETEEEPKSEEEKEVEAMLKFYKERTP